MHSKAATVQEYLAGLPEDRRAALSTVRDVILRNLNPGFAESMQYGMIAYNVPHSRYPAGYHCDPRQPLPFAGLASQKNHMSLHMMSLYAPGPEAFWFRAAWARTGKRLDMGKACIRFKRLDDLALDVVAEAFRRVTLAGYVSRYESALALQDRMKVERRGRSRGARAARGANAGKPPTSTSTEARRAPRKADSRKVARGGLARKSVSRKAGRAVGKRKGR